VIRAVCIRSFFCTGVFVTSLRDLISSFNYDYQYCVPNGTRIYDVSDSGGLRSLYLSHRDRTLVEKSMVFELIPSGMTQNAYNLSNNVQPRQVETQGACRCIDSCLQHHKRFKQILRVRNQLWKLVLQNPFHLRSRVIRKEAL
jgi:hypothetical protein